MQALFQGEIIQFRIPSDPKYVAMVRRAVQSIARSLGFSEAVAWDIELSVAEALANAVEHGSPEHGRNAVIVVCRVEEDKLTVDVRDEGPGFEPLGSPKQFESMHERGRGLRLIYRLMDRVNVRRTRKGSRIRMVKQKQSPKHTKATQ